MARRVVLTQSVSLDGFMEGPDRDISWHRVDDEVHSYLNRHLAAMGGFLSGRVTHQLMAEFWPTADQDPANAGPVAEFARIWREMPKIVYSRTLDRADWNTTVVREVVPAEVRALTAQPGGDLALGGANLAETFLRLGLVDEFHVLVHPVLVGAGTPLFHQARANLRLLGTRTFGNGVVLLRHERA